MIIPSLDILDNNIVRLYQGNYKKIKFYDNNLFFLIEQYRLNGAKLLHLVDLNGSRDPKKRQIKFIDKVVKNINIPVQIGGGIRNIEDIESLLLSGVKRVVIGSIAINNREEVKKWFIKYSEKLVLAVDVFINDKNIKEVKINGWREKTNVDMIDLISEYVEHGMKYLLCTDIKKDGTFNGPNISLYKEIVKKFNNLLIQASGGVSCLKDIEEIKSTGVNDVIVGRALLENRFNLSEAISCWQKGSFLV
ncbi:1-(5-phosphoribosyl)-5-[(5-phosphoribosylamino)methylideneamino]imidazole-4-carboxamide isomerase [Buchnera aphidicola (Ceratoglyphina bambusae)]|uniref:1-(5-phosphoribosyl)-5-[(5- phosphoribosylamino)methylideneamino]imidazole-4- carboxamide isomerase n=1 Tax=Buchnera aphidicola TaxID=9 RepID=UPI0031B88FD6